MFCKVYQPTRLQEGALSSLSFKRKRAEAKRTEEKTPSRRDLFRTYKPKIEKSNPNLYDGSSSSSSSETNSSIASIASDTDKLLRKVKKRLRKIEELKVKDPSILTDKERARITSEKELKDELALLLFLRVECICQNIDASTPKARD